MNIDKVKEVIELSIYKLIQFNTYIGVFTQNLQRIYTMDVPTLAVTFKDNQFCLLINPSFVEEYKQHIDFFICHEMFHLILFHLYRLQNKDKKTANYAMDLSVNSLIGINKMPKINITDELIKLQKQGIHLSKEKFLESFPPNVKVINDAVNIGLHPNDFDFPLDLDCEHYYDLLTKDVSPELKKYMEKDEDVSKHEVLKIDKKQNVELQKEILKTLLKTTYQKVQSYGNLPSNITQEINKFIKSERNWKDLLHIFVNYASNIKKVVTRKKRNRRYGITYPGKKTNYDLNLGIYIDSSGSTFTELDIFMAEVNKIYSDLKYNIEIMTGDTKTHTHYTMKKPFDINSFQVVGGGGTCATSWVSYINKQQLDCCIILTDGYHEDTVPVSKIPILWCLTESGATIEEYKAKMGYNGFKHFLKLTKEKHK